MTISISEAAQELLRWATSHRFRGQDPHDVLESPLLSRISSPAIRLAALQLGRRSPVDFRPFLRVPAAENPKGLALFLAGLVAAREHVSERWRPDATALAHRLAELQSPTGGWGYPFSWQSRTHYIPRGKPNIVTTAFCGLSLIQATEAGVLDAIDAVNRATRYILERIPQQNIGGPVAFGYAEEDAQIVYNASLLGAELLAGASSLLARPDLAATAARAAEYVVQRQQKDGSWFYGELPTQQWIDSFHTGFVIESLQTIAGIVHSREIEAAAERGLEYYLRTFVKSDGAIRYFPGKDYPIDAHAVGQAISMLARLGHVAEARRVAEYANDHLRSNRGYYYYQKHALYTNRIAYMRWSNAWMFKGLCDLIAQE